MRKDKDIKGTPAFLSIADLPESIRAEAASYDKNGDGGIDKDELVVLLEKQIQFATTNRLLIRMIVALCIVCAVTICVLAGVTFGIVNQSKDTKVSNDNQLQTKSGNPVLVASADFSVLPSGHAVPRNAPPESRRRLTSNSTEQAEPRSFLTGNDQICVDDNGDALKRKPNGVCPRDSEEISPEERISLKTELSTRQGELSCFFPDEYFAAMSAVTVVSPTGASAHLKVHGFIRHPLADFVPYPHVTLITRWANEIK